jgi:hypothetical protein
LKWASNSSRVILSKLRQAAQTKSLLKIDWAKM